MSKDVAKVLKDDGVARVELKRYENPFCINLETIRQDMGDGSWAVRIVYNKDFGGVLIQQMPGEGNRLHYHPDADECWIIMDGKLEWVIGNLPPTKVQKNDIIVVKAGTHHLIRNVGNTPGLRFAFTKPDVEHIHV